MPDNEFKYNISDDITFFSQIKNLFENYKNGLDVPSTVSQNGSISLTRR